MNPLHKSPDREGLHVLLIAPCAPPKNSPEAIQVSRLLHALDPDVRVTLVTTPIVPGWEPFDPSMTVRRPNMRVVQAKLPLHSLTHRLLSNHRLSRFHIPDPDFWLPKTVGRIVRSLKSKPDIIYSRSSPPSAALLARSLKAKLGIPWMMHLSDPWAGSPIRVLKSSTASAKDYQLERECFDEADAVAFTTAGQAEYYKERYPADAEKVFVSPNMLPNDPIEPSPDQTRNQPLLITYTGSFYGGRNPSTVLAAMNILESDPATAGKARVQFFGNMSRDLARAIGQTPGCVWLGPVNFKEATAAQSRSDVLLTIELGDRHPLLLHLLLSKVVDYLAIGKPILALTGAGSETEKLCRAGHGWALEPDDVEGLTNLIRSLITNGIGDDLSFTRHDPQTSPFRPDLVAGDLVRRLTEIAKGSE